MVWNPTIRKSLPPLQNKTVDVLIPTYNESLDILRITLLGCMDLKYPHKTYVLDDGNRPEVKALAEKLGCYYLTRENRIYAKAGNLNNALKHTSGEFILTLDADHVPLPTLIDETIGFFVDEKVALIQMPQDFYNLDSFQHMTDWKVQYSWHEQEFFYSVIQPGKDYWNAAFYCGSTTMIRRKALEKIGGFAVESITEDIHTALRLQARGWRSVYYNKTMARGVAPSTLTGFAIQRLRWGAGAMQVWKIDNPLTMKGLTIPQRLCYFASMYTYFDGFQKLIYLLTPIIILTTGILPILTDPATFIKYFIPYFFVSIYGMSLTMGGFRGMIKTEQYNLIKLVNQMKSVIKGLFGKEKYVVTPKGSETKRNINEVIVQIIITILGFIAIVKGIFYIASGYVQDGYLWAYVASIFWMAFYITLTIPVVIIALKKKDYRKLYRFDGKFDVTVLYSAPETSDEKYEGSGFARNISSCGCSITTDAQMAVGQILKLQISLPNRICINALGEVKRSTSLKISKDEVKYMSGVEFKNISDSDKDNIIRFLMRDAAPKQAEILKLSRATRIKD
jgi:cellulose synthase (UDP-forming)